MAKKRCMPLLLSKLRQQVNSHCSLTVCLPATKPFEWIRNLRDWEVKMELSMAITGWNSNLLGNREWTSVGGFPSPLSPSPNISAHDKSSLPSNGNIIGGGVVVAFQNNSLEAILSPVPGKFLMLRMCWDLQSTVDDRSWKVQRQTRGQGAGWLVGCAKRGQTKWITN